MMSNSANFHVLVLDKSTQTVLFKCDLSNIELAYKKALEFEEMGIDTEIKAPTLTESLIRSLGATDEDIQQFKESEEFEESLHEDSGCAICLDDLPTKAKLHSN